MNDRQADAIEVTRHMAQIGAQLLGERYDSFGDGVDKLIAAEIFTAMFAEFRRSNLPANLQAEDVIL